VNLVEYRGVTLHELSCGGHFVRVSSLKLRGSLNNPTTEQCDIDDLTLCRHERDGWKPAAGQRRGSGNAELQPAREPAVAVLANSNVPPRLLFPGTGTPGGPVPTALRVNDLSVALVFDRSGPNNTPPNHQVDDRLATTPIFHGDEHRGRLQRLCRVPTARRACGIIWVSPAQFRSRNNLLVTADRPA
jgi:hypothetical protein